ALPICPRRPAPRPPTQPGGVLDATAAAHAADDFLFTATGLTVDHAPREYLRVRPRERSILLEGTRADDDCPECGGNSASCRASDLGRRAPTRGNPACGKNDRLACQPVIEIVR